jgi:GNAT superfamily N-acetyltransferase
MRLAEILGYDELEGTRGNWAPYIVRRIETPEGTQFVVFQQSHRIGSARLSQDGKFIVDVSVLPEHQKRGIATALYRYIEKQLGYSLSPSPLYQTDAGKALWASRK